jgi:aspartate aminotransferase
MPRLGLRTICDRSKRDPFSAGFLPMFTPAERLRSIRKSATRVLYDSAPHGSINLGLGEPDFPTPEVVRREAIRIIGEERIGYTTNGGIQPLREKIAEYHSVGLTSSYGTESVCVTTGAEEALFRSIYVVPFREANT